MMLKRSEIFAVNGTAIYTPDAPFPFAFGHLQGSAGRALNGYTVKDTVRYGVPSFQNVRYSAMTLAEFREMYALFMQQSEYIDFTFYDPTIGARNTIAVYCNDISGDLMRLDGEGLIQNVTFTLVAK